MLNTDNTKPIYIQIAEWLETEILNGNLNVDQKVYSQYKLADMFTINPATAAKGLNLLYEENILYNKRGLGKFVAENAKDIIVDKRKNQKLKNLITELVLESERLEMKEEELMEMVQSVLMERKEEGK